MRFKWSKKYFYQGLTAFLVIAASILLLLLLINSDKVLGFIGMILSILTPIILGFAFAYLLNPILVFLENKCFKKLLSKYLDKHENSRLPRVLGITATILLALLIIVGLLSIILPQLIASTRGLIGSLPEYLNSTKLWADRFLAENEWLGPFFGNSFDSLISSAQSYLESATPIINEAIGNVTGFVIDSAIGVVNALTNFFLGLVVSIYVMFSKEKFAAQTKKILYAIFPRSYTNRVLRISRSSHKVFGGFISGKLLDSFIIGVLTFIVLAIVKMPYAVLVSVIIGVTNIIPFFGPIIGAVPCALIILFEDPWKAVLFVIIIIIIQQIDGNLIGPKILGDSTGLSAFWVIFAILLGGGLFGFLGMLLGVPTFAVIYSLIKAFIEERLKKKHYPSETKAYSGNNMEE